MPTMRELQDQSFRSETTSPTGTQAASVRATQTQQTNEVDLMARDIETLVGGASKIAKAFVKTSEYADKVRASDTYSNFVKGMHEIDKHYQDKLSEGQALTVRDYKDKKDWQERFLVDMTTSGIQKEDETNLIFKEKFISPARMYVDETSKRDTGKQFVQHQKDVVNKESRVADEMGKDMTSDVFNQSISNLALSGNDKAVAIESNATAVSYNTSFKATEASGSNYESIKDIVENEYPNVLKLDESGTIVRGDGFNQLTDEALSSMITTIQAGHKRMVAANKTKSIIDASNMKNSVTNINTAISNGSSIDELIPTYMKNVSKLDRAGYYNSTDRITSRGVINKNIAKYVSDRVKITSYLSDSGVVVDTEHLLNNMNADSITSKNRYIAIVDDSNSKISTSAFSMRFNLEDKNILIKQRLEMASMIDGMVKNSDFTGNDSGMIVMFKDIDKVGVKGKDALNVDSMYAYAIYREQQNKKLGVADTVSKSIYQAIENPELSELDKVKSAGIAISADIRNKNTTKANPFRRAETKEMIDGIYDGITTIDANVPESTTSVVNSIAVSRFPTMELQRSWLESKAKVNVSFDMLPFLDKTYALLVPDGVPDGESKMKSFINAMVIFENSKRANKIGKGDISFKAKEINGDLGYTAFIKSGEGYTQYEISKATLNHTDFLDENIENRVNAYIGKPVSEVEKMHAERQKQEGLSLVDLF